MKSQFFVLIKTLAILFIAPVASAAILDVPHNYNSIQEAMLQCQPGDRIHIAPGQYFEYDLVVPAGVTIVGMGDHPDQVVLDGQGLGRIMLCESLDEATIIQNITFTNGRASGAEGYDQNGGAILLNNSTIRLYNCNFINNSADNHGGALRFSHASPQVFNCYFEGNTAQAGGGAIDCSYDSNPRLNNCFFKMNEASWGGALSCRGNSSPIVITSNFDRNRATGELAYGGAVIADYDSSPIFDRCTFYANHARYGGAVACFETAQTHLRSCTLVNNSCEWIGAGLLCSNSFPVIENSIIVFQDGSAVACSGSAMPTISCTNIFGNDQGDWFGAIEPLLEMNDNMSADPLFCGLDPENDFHFRLQIDSPCADEESHCSVMGAWPAGCAITPIYLDNFTAIWSNGVPRITWYFNGQRGPGEFILMRSLTDAPKDEHQVPFQVQGGGFSIAFDHELLAKNSSNLVYRLYLVEEDESLTLISSAQLSAEGMLKPLHLAGVSPNPFNPRTTIRFENSQDRVITITVHDIRGRQVKLLSSQQYPAGRHEVAWNGDDSQGRRVESGTYFVTVRSQNMVRSQKVLLLK